jgi:hypothetical protein
MTLLAKIAELRELESYILCSYIVVTMTDSREAKGKEIASLS